MTHVQTIDAVSRTASIISHIKENNLTYLVGILVLHAMGFITPIIDKAQGVCL